MMRHQARTPREFGPPDAVQRHDELSNSGWSSLDDLDDDTGQTTIDPRAILAAVLRNRWPVAAIVFIALVAGLLSVMLADPVYRATASVQIDPQVAKVLGTEDKDAVQVGGSEDRFLQTQIDILKSRGMAEQVVDALRLPNDDAYLASIGIKPADIPKANRIKLRDGLIGAVQGSVGVNLPRSSRVAQINVEGREPAQAAKIANSYVDMFIAGNLQRKFDQSTYSRKFLQDQLEQTRIRLESSERAMVQFARDAGLIELTTTGADGSSTGQSLTSADLGKLNDALAAATGARIVAEQQWAQVQASPVTSAPEFQNNPGVQGRQQELAQARVEYLELRQRYGESYPQSVEKAAKIAALERELTRDAGVATSSARDRFEAARRQEMALKRKVDELKSDTLAERDRSVQYNILKREADTNRQLYDALLQRFKEVGAEAGVTTNNISVIDRAETPSVPISPRPLRSMMLAALLGMAAAGAFVFARERLTDSVRTPDDIEKRVGLPLLGVTPKLAAGASPVKSFADSKSQFSEAVHAIRASLELSTSKGLPTSLALTSARPSEGKSTLAFSLAREFAQAGKRVILIDADLRAPSLHRLFILRNVVGLSQILSKQIDLEEAIRPMEPDGLHVITSGPVPPNPTMLLDGDKLSQTIALLEGRYDLVLVDCPPILGLADALQICSQVEGAIMVIEARDTRFATLKAALGRLRDSRVHVFGAILSKFDAARFGYGEYYGYAFTRYGDGGEAPQP